ncbi:peptide chain release factor 1 (bRF-1) [Natranaerovirga hydrolytica]|uniref:Peptide chain release factor 1 n=1 Tax=Natranaerovirga hydrolytica TaxID=680378 RepID=A0A4R1MR92_9FIRM|nr:peptide chain release factor 1 [Natranaerovirga hydrolytica]TCK92413.1 peptide chain release factor 1 (bRF-1) [Natranaerovirga hydrolytica]
MFDKLEDIVKRYESVLEDINNPETVSDQDKFRKLMKEQSDLTPIVETYKKYINAKENIDESINILENEDDEDLKELAKEELNENKSMVGQLEEKLKFLLIPKDPNDDKNVFVEIRAGAGGDEAALFAANLFRMYSRYAERNNWKVETVSLNENGLGGFKEVIFMIKGNMAYSRLKYESGVHRVQRIPVTESGGRIHTSTVTVAVLPEADEVDVEISQNDLRIDVFRSSGNGGQSVNTTDSAVRITHMPTGIVVSCQDEKSQHKNKDKAMKVLRARLFEIEQEKQQSEQAENRKSQVGTGDRSEKIRTYNFPQGRVTDHRIKLTLHRLDGVLDGDIEELVESLSTADQTEKLKNIQE